MNNKHYSTFNLGVRSVIFTLLAVCLVVLYSFVCLGALPFPLKYRHGIIRSFLFLHLCLLKNICLIDYDVSGLENIPTDRNGIILSKHQSTWETFFLPLIFHDPAVILKRELLWVPFFGWGLAVSDPISINRKAKSGALQQIITKGTDCLKKGRWVLVFPEGTRIPYGQVAKYKLGGARLAAATGYPVIPVSHNAGRYWPKRGFIKQPGTVRIVIGPLMETKGLSAEKIMTAASEWIESTARRLG
ncbi:MAG: hypothetical protein A3E85_03970 [Gammaproteobacteria bacterium RIFCSPHIGHO2_12_FULL_45_12]|nr:MAG: hypothetical protein A3E85_03970 [Gammaproteobacteria bacterium RIFCSPHIGHO2_12_FULL_45_12]